MNSVRFLKITIALLVLMNIGVLMFMWLSRPKYDINARPPRPTAFEYLVHTLNLTPKQVEQYTVLRDAHHEAFEQIWAKGHQLRDELYTHLGDSTDNGQIEALTDSLAANQRETELLTFNHFRKLRAICTPQQQKELDDVIGKALNMIGPPPPPHGPPPPGELPPEGAPPPPGAQPQ
jgi:periplasmic protein CpxP/Spy